MVIQKVALIGANGTLGPSVLYALLAVDIFSVTVISRKTSNSTYPDSVKVSYVSDDPTPEELVGLLKGQDALVTTFAGSNSDLQIRLAEAAAQAGVQRFIPADFGSCDSSSPRALELMPLYREKTKVREHLQQLSTRSNLTWTSLVCGHFFDYGLKPGLLQFDLKTSKAQVFDDGETKWSATTLARIGLAVVRVLQRADATKNRALYIQSFCTTQNKVLASLESITQRKWQVSHINSEDFVKEMKEEVDANPENDDARENLIGVVGIIEANWEIKEGFANSLLGLEDENLDEVIKKVISK